MALLAWESKYSVGVQSIDKQHTVLFDILNELHSAMMQGQAQQAAGPLLQRLVDYTRNHFSSEEALMAKAQYAGLAQHKIKHQELLKQVDEFVARHKRREATLNVHLLTFLRDWLTQHIQCEDRDYGPCLVAKGIK